MGHRLLGMPFTNPSLNTAASMLQCLLVDAEAAGTYAHPASCMHHAVHAQRLQCTFPASARHSSPPACLRCAGHSKLTAKDIENIEEVAAQPDILRKLAHSLAPSIHGHSLVKAGLVLQLLGGRERILDNGTHLRGDINCLMVSPDHAALWMQGWGQAWAGKPGLDHSGGVSSLMACPYPAALLSGGHGFCAAAAEIMAPMAASHAACRLNSKGQRRHVPAPECCWLTCQLATPQLRHAGCAQDEGSSRWWMQGQCSMFGQQPWRESL